MCQVAAPTSHARSGQLHHSNPNSPLPKAADDPCQPRRRLLVHMFVSVQDNLPLSLLAEAIERLERGVESGMPLVKVVGPVAGAEQERRPSTQAERRRL